MTVPLSCREFTDFLTAYVDGDLPLAEAAEFERHIDACPPCGVYLHSYKETVRLARLCAGGRSDPPADAPEGLITAILAARRAGEGRHDDGPLPPRDSSPGA
ncbi:MAG: anti-sigma factor family protein [Planctomycetota bacterium]|jgi:anti-sigma factor RsiW